MTAHRPGPYCAIHDAAHPPCDPGPVISSDAPVVLSPDDADRVAALIEARTDHAIALARWEAATSVAEGESR